MSPAPALQQSVFAAALLDPARPCPPGLRAWNGSDPAARLTVYRNNVISSLVDALAETFPVVQELIGEEFFRAMAALFVRQAPPRSRILAHYGAEMPDFIAQFEPARSVPYLADMARLEIARVRAFHAADAETLSAESVNLAMANADHIGASSLACHPSVQLVSSPYAIVSLWAAHQGEDDLSSVDPFSAEAAMILRQGLDVIVLRLPPGGAEFVAALQQGRCLDDAVQAAMVADPGFDLTAHLALLLAHGALSGIQTPRRQTS